MTVTGIISKTFFWLSIYSHVMIMHFFTSYNVELLLQSTSKINKEYC